MGSSSDKPLPPRGLAAALELFAPQARRIEDLFEFDESFRGLCEDLADAQATLKHTMRLPDDIREARQLEYRELVTALSNEIEDALSKAKVIHFRHTRHPSKPR
jgi:hypothetical protein